MHCSALWQGAPLTQRCSVEIIGNDPNLHGRTALVLSFSDATACYDIRLYQNLDDGRDTFCLPPANVVLQEGICVTIQGLTSFLQHNGKLARIIECDRSAQLYTVKIKNEQLLKLKFGNVVC